MKKRLLLSFMAVGIAAGTQAGYVRYQFNGNMWENGENQDGFSAGAITWNESFSEEISATSTSVLAQVSGGGPRIFAISPGDTSIRGHWDENNPFLTSYFEFTVTPDSGYQLDFSASQFDLGWLALSDNNGRYRPAMGVHASTDGGSSWAYLGGGQAFFDWNPFNGAATNATLQYDGTTTDIEGYGLDSGSTAIREGTKNNMVWFQSLGELAVNQAVTFRLAVGDASSDTPANVYHGVDLMRLDLSATIPEPATIGMLGIGSLLMMLMRRMRR